MSTANEELLDAFIRHQIYLLRYAGFVRNNIYKFIDGTEAEIARRIRDGIRNKPGLTTPRQIERLESLQRTVARIRAGAWDDANTWLLGQLEELAETESNFLAALFVGLAPVTLAPTMPTAAARRAVALDTPTHGYTAREWLQRLRNEDLRRINDALLTGATEGLTGGPLAQRVVGTRAQRGSDGATDTTRQHVASVVQTVVTHVSANVQSALLLENIEVFNGEVFTAVLDGKTTAICRSLDGRRFAVGLGPRPPLHIRCRSRRVPFFDGEALAAREATPTTARMLLREFATQADVPVVRSRGDLPRGTRGAFDDFAARRIRELVGTVPGELSFADWLRRQPVEFQNDVLGVRKARLFRNGGLTLDRFVAANGTELTLAQLAARHADAFRAAGMDPAAFIR